MMTKLTVCTRAAQRSVGHAAADSAIRQLRSLAGRNSVPDVKASQAWNLGKIAACSAVLLLLGSLALLALATLLELTRTLMELQDAGLSPAAAYGAVVTGRWRVVDSHHGVARS